MSGATELRSFTEPYSETLPAPDPGGNSARVVESFEAVQKKAVSKKPQNLRNLKNRLPESVIRCDMVSADGSCSSDSSCSLSSLETENLGRRRKANVAKPVKVVPNSADVSPPPSPALLLLAKRCGWITPNSDPLYVSFHDEEWGVPVHEDRKLFELLVLSEALSEFSWPTILNKRETFRKLFDNFDPELISKFTEKKILMLKASALLSEPKLRAIVENARQMLKVAEEIGSFNRYCWSFVNHKPVVNGFRYARQVPVKTPKAEAMSKDLMRRGFRCVGPTIIYSFMQAAGIVNDHLSNCFRYQECSNSNVRDCKTEVEETEALAKAMEKKTCLLNV